MTSAVARAIEEKLLGGPRRWTALDIAGDRLPFARRLWQAMGFPGNPDDAVVLTDLDRFAFQRISQLVGEGLTDEDTAVRIARAMGQTMSRLVEWQLDTVIDEAVAQADSSQADYAAAQADILLPELEALLLYVLRRQLAAAATRAVGEHDDVLGPPPTAEVTVGFADIVGFTLLSRRKEPEELARIVETFEFAGADAVAARGGRLVKTLGDELMFTAAPATVAVEIAAALLALGPDDDGLPPMRIGLATGPVLSRMGDVFGTTVNTASRLTTLARPGTVLLDAATAEAIAGTSRYELLPVGKQSLRGLGDVEAFVLDPFAER